MFRSALWECFAVDLSEIRKLQNVLLEPKVGIPPGDSSVCNPYTCTTRQEGSQIDHIQQIAEEHRGDFRATSLVSNRKPSNQEENSLLCSSDPQRKKCV